MTTLVDLPRPTDRRVEVWFGEHLIADYIVTPMPRPSTRLGCGDAS